jgi:signal transduction histidine kinase
LIRFSLVRKITLVMTLVIAVLLFFTSLCLNYWVRREVTKRVRDELVSSGQGLQEILVSRADRLEKLCSSVADSPRFKAAIEETDARTILDTGKDEMKVVHADLLVVLGRNGNELARVAPGQLPADRARPGGAIASAFAGKHASEYWAVAGEFYQVAAAPVQFGDTVSGVVVIGNQTTKETALRVKRLTRTDAAFAVGPDIKAGTFPPALAKALMRREFPAPGEPQPLELDGDHYEELVVELRNGGGPIVARGILLRSLDEALAYLATIQWSLLGATAIVGLLAIVLSLLLARAITNPLEMLVNSTRQVQSGNYDEPVRVHTSDEIGLLAIHFDEMRASLKSKIAALIEEERMRAEMEIERHRSLSQMVAGVAHEINTPLGIVNQAASVITETLESPALESAAKDEEAATCLADLGEAAQLIQGNIARANTLIQSFKNLSVRQVSDQLTTVELRELLEEIVGLFRIKAKQARLTLELKCPPKDCSWTGYPGLLSQVVMNLLSNVERYAYPAGTGGTVEVLLEEADTYRLTVRDHGVGIAPENLSKVFEVFFTTGRAKGGSGLGLAIVHSLVTGALKGTIHVESQPGSGARFILTFPREIQA